MITMRGGGSISDKPTRPRTLPKVCVGGGITTSSMQYLKTLSVILHTPMKLKASLCMKGMSELRL